jgi:hypothetical protein
MLADFRITGHHNLTTDAMFLITHFNASQSIFLLETLALLVYIYLTPQNASYNVFYHLPTVRDIFSSSAVEIIIISLTENFSFK